MKNFNVKKILRIFFLKCPRENGKKLSTFENKATIETNKSMKI